MLTRQINNILMNGRADTAAERINNLVIDYHARSVAVRRLVEAKATELVDEPKTLTPHELVEAVTSKKGVDVLSVCVLCLMSALFGAAVVWGFL